MKNKDLIIENTLLKEKIKRREERDIWEKETHKKLLDLYGDKDDSVADYIYKLTYNLFYFFMILVSLSFIYVVISFIINSFNSQHNLVIVNSIYYSGLVPIYQNINILFILLALCSISIIIIFIIHIINDTCFKGGNFENEK